jgi:hypothetical protein
VFAPDALPTPVPPVLEEVRGWAEQAATAGSPEERAAWLAGMREVVDALEAGFTQALAVFDAHGDGQTLHAAATTASWLRGALRLAPGDATQRVAIARGSRDLLAEPIKLQADGAVTHDQVRAIERAIRQLPEAVKAEAVSVLTDLARQADVTAVRVAGNRLRHVVDPDGALTDAEKQFDRRYLNLSPLLDGMTAVDGLLDPEATEVLSTALAPFLQSAGPHDERNAAQRRADGLIDVAKAAMDAALLPELSGIPAQLQVLVPYDTLTARSTSSAPAQLPEHPAGQAWLTAPTFDRLACDATVARILLGPDSLPMELGRAQRLFTPHQRRALAIRDGGCRFPGCARPARYTDAHHIQPWQQGGLTDLSNALLLCRHHHRVTHGTPNTIGWTITYADPGQGPNDRVWFTRPDGQRFPSDPRGP